MWILRILQITRIFSILEHLQNLPIVPSLVISLCFIHQTVEFQEEMAEGIEDKMTTDGEVTSVTSSPSCTSTESAGFSWTSSSSDADLPFSSWNLNTYSFANWFLLMFLLCSGCFLCFAVGYGMHRRRVMKTLEDLSVQSLGAGAMDQRREVAMVPTSHSPKVNVNAPVHATNVSVGDAVYTPAEAEIEIGVSVHQSKMGMLRDYD